MADTVRVRKIAIVVAVVLTSIIPVLFVPLNEPRADLNVYKLLAKAGSLCGTMLIVWQFLLGWRTLAGRVVVDLIWVLDLLRKHLQRDPAEHEFLICGPPAMTTKLEAALREEGVPADQIHHELLSY